MGKHVCPVCEDVYAAQASVHVRQNDRTSVTSGWGCPACGYIFIGLADVAELVRWVDPSEATPASITGRLLGEPAVIRRTGPEASAEADFAVS